jgi:hypothetical protein
VRVVESLESVITKGCGDDYTLTFDNEAVDDPKLITHWPVLSE